MSSLTISSTATPRAPLTQLAPADELARQRAERMSLYREIADLTVDTSRASPDEIAETIADAADRDWTGPVSS